MAITVGTSTYTSGASTTGFTLGIDSGVSTGDLLLLGIVNRNGTVDPTVTDDDSGGNTWTKLLNQAQSTNGSISVWWKRATGSTAGKTITVSGCTNSCAGICTPYTGVSGATTPFGTPVSESNSSTNHDQAGITVDRANSFVLAYVGITHNYNDNPNTVIATDPTSLTTRGSGTSTGGNHCEILHASAVKTTAGATGTVSWSQTVTGQGCSAVVELIVSLGALTAAGASYTVTGTDASMNIGHPSFSVAAGSFALTGTAATLKKGSALTAEPGSFDMNGANATLRYTPSSGVVEVPRRYSNLVNATMKITQSIFVRHSERKIQQ